MAVTVYLWINAVLYAGFAAWCLISVDKTAKAVGYLQLSEAGRIEYATVYGGLQLGMAAFFAVAAYRMAWSTMGLVFALLIYTAIVLVRWTGVLRAARSPGSVTLAVASMETLLWLGAIVLAGRTYFLNSSN